MALLEVEFLQVIQLTDKDDKHTWVKALSRPKGIKQLTETPYGVQVNGSWIYPWHLIKRVRPAYKTVAKPRKSAPKAKKTG